MRGSVARGGAEDGTRGCHAGLKISPWNGPVPLLRGCAGTDGASQLQTHPSWPCLREPSRPGKFLPACSRCNVSQSVEGPGCPPSGLGSLWKGCFGPAEPSCPSELCSSGSKALTAPSCLHSLPLWWHRWGPALERGQRVRGTRKGTGLKSRGQPMCLASLRLSFVVCETWVLGLPSQTGTADPEENENLCQLIVAQT